MFEIKFIKNPPTVENLKSFYESDVYQDLLSEFAKRSKHKLDNREQNTTVLFNKLTRYQNRYLILNIPFEEVLSEFEKNKDDFLNYQIAAITFFNEKVDENPAGEFPKGEEPDEDDKSEVIEVFGIDKTFFIDKFCEFYLLKTGDKERLLHFLKTTRMPFAKKYAGQITKLYNQNASA
jgi:hypothetical protein